MAPRITATFYSPQDELLGVCPFITDVSREWVWNDTAPASFSMAGGTSRLFEYINWGNIVRLHEEGMPTWVGVALERKWGKGNVTLSLQSAEWLLQKKPTGQGLIFGASGGVSSGSIARNLLGRAIQNSLIKNIKPGTLDATPLHFQRFDYADLWDALKGLADVDGSAFWVDDLLRVHFRNARGTDKSVGATPIILYEDTQLVDVEMTERITNSLTAAISMGDGSTLAARPKYTIAARSDRLYRAEVLNFNGHKTPASLVNPTQDIIRTRIQPEIVIDATMVKYNSRSSNAIFAEWGKAWVGDTVVLVIYSRGYSNPLVVNAKVIGVSIEQEDKIRLVVSALPSTVVMPPFVGWSPI